MTDENSGFTLDLSQKEGRQRLHSSGGKGTGYALHKLIHAKTGKRGQILTEQDRQRMLTKHWMESVQRREDADVECSNLATEEQPDE